MCNRTLQCVLAMVAIVASATVGETPAGDSGRRLDELSAAPAARPGTTNKVSRLGAISVPYEHFQWYVDHGYNLIARVSGGPDGSAQKVHAILQSKGIAHYNFGRGSVRPSEMGNQEVPSGRQQLKRGPGANKYTNLDALCGGWDRLYEIRGRKTAAEMKDAPTEGMIFEDYLNRSLCYCESCEAEYRRDTGRPGFPHLVYDTPHYEDTVAFDPVLIAWDQQRTAKNFRTMAAPIHQAGKKVAVAGVCRWIIGPEAAAAVDEVMFYTYYSGRRLPANYMRNWKYWHDHLVPDNLWVIFGYFREYHECHTRLMLANLPDGVNLAFWACQRQMADASARDDALYACDVVQSSLVPIRIAVYESPASQVSRASAERSWRENHVEKAIVGFERLGFDAQALSSLDDLDAFELLYMEDVECLSRADLDRIRKANIPVLAAGVTGLRDETGRLWRDADASLPRANKGDKVLNLPAPVALLDDRVNIEVETLKLDHPWFEFIFDTISESRGDAHPSRPYTDPSRYRGIRRHALSLIPSRVYGEFLADAAIAYYDGVPLAFSSERMRPMIVYQPDAQQVYSTVKFSDYVNVHDLTECGYGYQMRQFCFLQIIDALTLPRRGVRVDPYLMTAVRRTATGHFITIGNVHDEPRIITVTLSRQPKQVRVNHVDYDRWAGSRVTLPPIGPKDAIQVHVDY